MTPRPLPPIKFLNEALEISATSDSGLVWKKRPRHHFATSRGHKISVTRDAGKPAGRLSLSGDGAPRYLVKINQVKYPAHRVVYALHSGIDPYPFEVDHVDRNPKNNNPGNLRTATRRENARNKFIPKNNKSGCRGVTYCSRTSRWMAQIGHNSKCLFLGRFKDKNQAIKARQEAESAIHGKFEGEMAPS